MICPNCKKPYYFIKNTNTENAKCLRCDFEDTFENPIYDDYHEELYAKPYTRTIKTDPQMRLIINKLSIKNTNSILDIGCGVGDHTKAIHNINKNIIGLDLNTDSARKKYPDITFISHDCNKKIPYPDESFDIVVSINLIEHLKDYENFLSECRRILKKGGRIAITTANLDFILHDYFYDKTHVHEWTLSQFRKIMEKYFKTTIIEKSSSMFNYYPINKFTTKFLKPDLLFIGTKQ